MTNIPKFKGIIFDLDGTLAFSQEIHYQAYSSMFKSHGVEYSAAADREHAGRGGMYTIPTIFAEHEISVSKEEAMQYLKQKNVIFEEIVNKKGIRTVPGVTEFLQYCRGKNIPMMIATGARRETALFVLKTTGLLEYFPEIVTVEDVENPKPAPDIFLLAAKKLGLKPSECAVLEDAESGIKAAKDGGFFCIAVATGSSEWQLKQFGASMVITDYHELQTKNIF